jgi:hypothetical protein
VARGCEEFLRLWKNDGSVWRQLSEPGKGLLIEIRVEVCVGDYDDDGDGGGGLRSGRPSTVHIEVKEQLCQSTRDNRTLV